MALSKRDIQSIVYKGVFIFALALLLWFVSQCATDKSKEQEVPSTTLQVGVDITPDGFGINAEGQLTGLQKELVELLLPEDSIEWVPYTERNEAYAALHRGDISLYATSYPYAQSQELEDVLPTEWIYHESFSLLLSKEKQYSWEEEFQQIGTTTEVYVSEEEPAAKVILTNLGELSYPAIEVVESELTPTQLCIQLVNGTLDYVLANQALVHSIAEADTTLTYIDQLSFATQQVWLVHSENQELKQRLDSAILAHRSEIKR